MANPLDPAIFASIITPSVLSPAAGAGAYETAGVAITSQQIISLATSPVGQATKFTFSMWVKSLGDAYNASQYIWACGSVLANTGIIFWLNRPIASPGVFYPEFFCYEGANFTRGKMSLPLNFFLNKWCHILISGDWSSATPVCKARVSIPGARDVSFDANWSQKSQATTNVGPHQSPWWFGRRTGFGDQPFYGELGDIWFKNDYFLDIDVEANRRYFIDADGNPALVDIPGVTPEVYLHSNDPSTFTINHGSGANFSSGALGTASTPMTCAI